jgi:hypothetical protein
MTANQHLSPKRRRRLAAECEQAGYTVERVRPVCYVLGCGETEDLDYIGELIYVCQKCKVTYQHQQRMRDAYVGEEY